MEHQNESENSDGYVRGGYGHSNSGGRLSSSSISSASDIKSALTDFSFDDMYQMDKFNKGSFAIDNEQCDAPQTLPEGDVPQTLPDDDAATLESPPVQVMERPAETSGYRIPSYVFATTKSTHQEWSTTSNESLFSIHTGNMSFTRDQFSWLLKSGELGIYGGPGDIPKSGELPPPSPVHVPKSGDYRAVDYQKEERFPVSSRETLKSGEEIIAAHFKTLSTTSRTSFDKEPDSQGTSSSQMSENADSQRTSSYQTSENADSQGTSSSQTSDSGDYQVTSSSQMSENAYSEAGMKKDDLILDVKDKVSSPSASEDRVPLTNCISHHSDTSGQSFAFPVLTEISRDKSVNSGQSHVRADLRKNSSANDQEATTQHKPPTAEANPSYYAWFSSCFSCSCCKES